MQSMKTYLLIALATGLPWAKSVGIAQEQTAESNSKVVLSSEIEWQQLNPARGDKSPQAATLWGDRNGTVPTGFLVKFVDGFSSPPHIHNVTYRGVVISGLVHNDDPDAKPMWMPTGSFWTQPAGEVHITSAMGESTVAYIEIEKGPYLVLSTEQAFDRGERPVNVDASNIVWLDASNTNWIHRRASSNSANGPKLAFLWGNPHDDHLNGALVKLPAGFTGKIQSRGSAFRAIVIQGRTQLQMQGGTDVKTMEPGSFFSSNEDAVHQLSCEAREDCIIYVRSKGKFDVIPTKPNE